MHRKRTISELNLLSLIMIAAFSIAFAILLIQIVSADGSHYSAMTRPISAGIRQEAKDEEELTSSSGANMLMVGNSYTAANNLTAIVQSMLQHRRGAEVYVTNRTVGGAHLKEFSDPIEPFESLLKERPWDWVVLQEQSEVPGLFQTEYSLEWIASSRAILDLDRAITSAGAQTILFQTWGRLHHDDNPTESIHQLYDSFDHHQARIDEGYNKYQKALARQDRRTLIAPVGLAFKAIHDSVVEQGLDPEDDDGDFALLYEEDGSHPSIVGSYLASCVIIGTATGEDLRQYTWDAPGIPVGVQERLRQVATTTVSDFCQECINKNPKAYIPKEQEAAPPSSSLPFRHILLFALVAVTGSLAWKKQDYLRQALVPLTERQTLMRNDDFAYSQLLPADDTGMAMELISNPQVLHID